MRWLTIFSSPLAMKQGGGNNPEQEIVETIGVEKQKAKEYNERMATGHVLFQQQVAVVGLDGREVPKNTLIHCRSLYMVGAGQQQVLNHVIETSGQQQDPIYVDGTGAKERDEKLIREYLSSGRVEEDQENAISLVLGTPSNLEPCFAFDLRRNYNNNIMCIGEDTELRMRILKNVVLSLQTLDEKEIYLICDENDPMFRGKYRSIVKGLVGGAVKLLTDYEEICEFIDRMLHRAVDRQRGRDFDETPVFAIWIGLDNMISIFQTSDNTKYVGKKTSGRAEKKKESVSIDSLTSMFDSLFQDDQEEAAPEEPQEDELWDEEEEDGIFGNIYNAEEDIKNLMMQGPKNGIFSYVTYSSTAPMMANRRIMNLDRFVHRIALKMDENSSGDFLNNKTRIASSELKEGNAVYYNGGRTGRYFIPYK